MISYLSEKGYVLAPHKREKLAPVTLQDEVKMQDTMVSSLVELLEEHGQLKYNDWEKNKKENC